MRKLSRRSFIATSAAAGLSAVPRFSIAQPAASEKVNIAAIGAGGRAGASLNACSGENIVALCDVDQERAANAYKRLPNAKRFSDFRVMFDKMGDDIDAVLVSTPDHTHFSAAMEAMERGKHVYVEKPLAHNVWQVRTLKKAARHYKIISQMGNQGHATEGIRYIKEWTEAGVLGDVTEVLAWNSGPNFTGPYFSNPDSFPPKAEPVPETLDWNLWLGSAKERPYNHCYLPRHWRGWYDFGNGQLGDWACHTLDGPFWALGLGMPTVVEAELRSEGPADFVPEKSVLRFEFPARGSKPPVTLTWHDGSFKPEVREEWGVDKLDGMGMLMLGSKRNLITGGRPNDPRLMVSDEEWLEFRKNLPEKTHARIEGGPWAEWLDAIKGDGPMPGSNFDYSSDLTEMALLGVMAQRFGGRIEYDAKQMKVTNRPELNAYINEPAREGWRYGQNLWEA